MITMPTASIESLSILWVPIGATGDSCPQAVFRRRRNTGRRRQQRNFTSPSCDGDHFRRLFAVLPDLFPNASRFQIVIQSP